MSTPAQQRDALMPRRPEGMGRGLAMAIAAHVLLVAGLAISVNWRSSEPPAMEAELWAAVPQVAAPPRQAPPPEPPPEPVQPKAPPKVETPPPKPLPDAQIAIEKARKERLKEEKELKERKELEKKLLEKKELEKKELERKEQLKREQADKQRDAKKEAERKRLEQEKQERALAEALREKQLQRILEQAGTGGNGSNGTAARSAGPSSSYGGRVKAAIYPNITFVRELESNPMVDVEVRTAPDGVIMSRRIIKSSGVKEWDDAVLDAIDKTGKLPRDGDKPPPSSMVIGFKPRDR